MNLSVTSNHVMWYLVHGRTQRNQVVDSSSKTPYFDTCRFQISISLGAPENSSIISSLAQENREMSVVWKSSPVIDRYVLCNLQVIASQAKSSLDLSSPDKLTRFPALSFIKANSHSLISTKFNHLPLSPATSFFPRWRNPAYKFKTQKINAKTWVNYFRPPKKSH